MAFTNSSSTRAERNLSMSGKETSQSVAFLATQAQEERTVSKRVDAIVVRNWKVIVIKYDFL